MIARSASSAFGLVGKRSVRLLSPPRGFAIGDQLAQHGIGGIQALDNRAEAN